MAANVYDQCSVLVHINPICTSSQSHNQLINTPQFMWNLALNFKWVQKWEKKTDIKGQWSFQTKWVWSPAYNSLLQSCTRYFKVAFCGRHHNNWLQNQWLISSRDTSSWRFVKTIDKKGFFFFHLLGYSSKSIFVSFNSLCLIEPNTFIEKLCLVTIQYLIRPVMLIG